MAEIQEINLPLFMQIMQEIQQFNNFNRDNDPYGEHDCAIIEVNGTRAMFKIDYYDDTLEF